MDAELRELIMGLDRRIDQRFMAIDQRFVAIDQRFEAMDQRFDSFERRIERLEERFDQFKNEIQDMLVRFSRDVLAEVDRRLELVLRDVNELHRTLRPNEMEYYAMEGRLSICERRIDRHNEKIARIEERLDIETPSPSP
ncbi:hypothetical protein [Alicyclobacillus sp.]|uniref:hypothetical protein n=1 Tax=Alicyclobacillus sp. TaxID=61169 RepID=UPI0025C6F0D1|nr:hypothetical protein [Alicyclobacillus sp.]MCL6517859.1 hypothetical protein [Alicyclobacillus sp.]